MAMLAGGRACLYCTTDFCKLVLVPAEKKMVLKEPGEH